MLRVRPRVHLTPSNGAARKAPMDGTDPNDVLSRTCNARSALLVGRPFLRVGGARPSMGRDAQKTAQTLNVSRATWSAHSAAALAKWLLSRAALSASNWS